MTPPSPSLRSLAHLLTASRRGVQGRGRRLAAGRRAAAEAPRRQPVTSSLSAARLGSTRTRCGADVRRPPVSIRSAAERVAGTRGARRPQDAQGGGRVAFSRFRGSVLACACALTEETPCSSGPGTFPHTDSLGRKNFFRKILS